MIKIELEDKIYTINDDYKLSPNNELLENSLGVAISQYKSPADGFKTSFVADKLKTFGFNVVDILDEDLEDSPEGIVY